MSTLRALIGAAILLLAAVSCNNDRQYTTYNETISDLSKQRTAQRVAKKDSGELNTEGYDLITENDFLSVAQAPLSTFSIDVDPAAYSNVRRFIQNGSMPPPGAVRIEEMINYFKYDYAAPENDDPFAVHSEMGNCPWNSSHLLARIALKGKEIDTDNLPPANLVLLVDVSGSMDEENKLPLVKTSLRLLTEKLREQDQVAIVVYAGAAGLVLPSTPGDQKQKILDAIEKLQAGGSTAGAAGIRLAYNVAKENFKPGGNNRVILATDGDFNVGLSSEDELVSLIETERKANIFLTVLGFGTGNYQDNKMQLLADKGNGNHAYIDNLNEARKVLVKEFGSTLFAIAKDVKIQVEFNPAAITAYRLIGYENRLLQNQDFNDDRKDAGELGAGHTVTALYEIVPAGVKDSFTTKVDPLKYQASRVVNNVSDELMTVKLRYKKPGTDQSALMVKTVLPADISSSASTGDFRFAAAVAEFGLLLRHSAYRQNASYEQLITLATGAAGTDQEGYRKEFIELVKKAAVLDRK